LVLLSRREIETTMNKALAVIVLLVALCSYYYAFRDNKNFTMSSSSLAEKIRVDERRVVVAPGNKQATIDYCVREWIRMANEAIDARGQFTVALSGGSTPKAIFELLTRDYADAVDWQKVRFFWSDERSVPLDDSASNFRMAMEAGVAKLDNVVLGKQLFPMRAAGTREIDERARDYERSIVDVLGDGARFDLVMLGMGEDGHTASLFPRTDALRSAPERLVVGNVVPQLDTVRMTFSYALINQARAISLYVLGASKADTLVRVFSAADDQFTELPSLAIGTADTPAHWIVDDDAFSDAVRQSLTTSNL
jgi:6-phosphogluconolactonase